MAFLEANLKTELVAAFERAGCVCHKFSDLARGMKKPHDLVCGIHGIYVGIETKLKKIGSPSNPGRWHNELIVVKWGDLSDNQHKALRTAEQRGSIAFVIGGIYDLYDHDRRAFAIPYSKFLTRMVWTLADCYQDAIQVEWTRGLGWNVDGIVLPIATKGAEAFR